MRGRIYIMYLTMCKRVCDAQKLCELCGQKNNDGEGSLLALLRFKIGSAPLLTPTVQVLVFDAEHIKGDCFGNACY